MPFMPALESNHAKDLKYQDMNHSSFSVMHRVDIDDIFV